MAEPMELRKVEKSAVSTVEWMAGTMDIELAGMMVVTMVDKKVEKMAAMMVVRLAELTVP